MFNDTTKPSYISHHLLVAMPGLLDPIFSKAVVYLAEHSGEGAMGIVINKPCELDLHALLTRLNLRSKESQSASEPVYYGGPIQQDRGFVLHEPASTWSSTLRINEALALTSSKDILGNFSFKIFLATIVDDEKNGPITTSTSASTAS